MSITLIPSRDRNTYFGKTKRSLGTLYEYELDGELRKNEPSGRVVKTNGARIFSRRFPCRECGWMIDYNESVIQTMCGLCTRYYHEFCYEVNK